MQVKSAEQPVLKEVKPLSAEVSKLLAMNPLTIEEYHREICLRRTAEEMLETGVVKFKGFPSPCFVSPIIEGIKLLRSESREYQQGWEFDECSHDDPDIGILRDRKGGDKDKKLVVHINRRLRNNLRARKIEYRKYMPMLLLAEKFEAFHTNIGYALFQRLDEIIPGFEFVKRAEAADWYHIGRFVIYKNDPHAEKTAAVGHFDRNGMTCHSLSNRRGLYTRNPQGKDILANETGMDDITFFPSAKLALATGAKKIKEENKPTRFEGGLIKPTYHGVMETRQTAEEIAADSEDRWSAIYFMHVLV